MNPKVIESMTKIGFNKHRIRIWREESSIEQRYDETFCELRNIVAKMIESSEEYTIIDVVKRLLEVDRVNAVEYTNTQGNGLILYREWP